MAVDSEGQTYGVSSAVWFDDGHSADWQHGTVTGFLSVPANGVAIHQDDGMNNLIVPQRWVHVGKPADPPDHT